MYRCIMCDHPAQMGHSDNCEAAERSVPFDPWGWEEQAEKLDIQAGVRVKESEMELAG
jgi:hypothetical protein